MLSALNLIINSWCDSLYHPLKASLPVVTSCILQGIVQSQSHLDLEIDWHMHSAHTACRGGHQDSIGFGPEVHNVPSQSALQSRKYYLGIQWVQDIRAPDVMCCVVSYTIYSITLGAWGWHETAVWYISRLQHTLYVTLQGLCLSVWKIFKFSESLFDSTELIWSIVSTYPHKYILHT